MKLSYTYLVISILLYSFPLTLKASAPSSAILKQRLILKLEALINQPGSDSSNITKTVTLLASQHQLETLCDNPELKLTGNDSRLTGKRTVAVRCGKHTSYLPFRICAHGTWWVASQNLNAGEIVKQSDIKPVNGNLNNQPAGLVFNANDIVGQRLTRSLTAGKPMLRSLLRQQWLLRTGQTVELVTSGPGFRIRSQATALNNATIDSVVKVKTPGGRIVNGKVNSDGEVIIFLQK